MSKSQIADQILTDIAVNWIRNGERGCPHCGKHNDLNHAGWCQFENWLQYTQYRPSNNPDQVYSIEKLLHPHID